MCFSPILKNCTLANKNACSPTVFDLEAETNIALWGIELARQTHS